MVRRLSPLPAIVVLLPLLAVIAAQGATTGQRLACNSTAASIAKRILCVENLAVCYASNETLEPVIPPGIQPPPENATTLALLYGAHTCPHCRATWEALSRLREAGILDYAVFVDVSSREGGDAFAQLYKRWYVPLCNQRILCAPPGVPMTYIRAGNASALIIGELAGGNETLNWVKILKVLKRGYAPNPLGGYTSFHTLICMSMPGCQPIVEEAARKLCSTGAPRSTHSEKSLLALIPVLVGLALWDAINPCFLTLYALTIAAVAGLRGKRGALVTGSAVAFGVFTGYYLLGLGLVTALTAIPWLKYAMAAAVIALGGFVLLRETGVLKTSDEQCLVCRLAAKLHIGSAEMTPMLGYAFGLIASLTLLPCSAGPYAVAAIYLSGLPELQRLIGLLVYNLVFIAPILAMAGAASLVTAYAKAEKVLRYISGPLLILLGILIIIGYA